MAAVALGAQARPDPARELLAKKWRLYLVLEQVELVAPVKLNDNASLPGRGTFTRRRPGTQLTEQPVG
jgi:hypothetical protein